MMNRNFGIGILVLVVLFISNYLYTQRDQLVILNHVKWTELMVLWILVLFFFYLTGFTFKLVVNLLNVNLSVWETMGLVILTNFGNYLGPFGPGSAFKGVYLKYAKQLSYAQFTSVFTVNSILALMMTGGCGFFLCLWLIHEGMEIPVVPLGIMCLLLAAGVVLLFVLKLPYLEKKGKIREVIQSALDGFQKIRSQRFKIFFIAFFYIMQFLVLAMIYQFTFYTLGVPIRFLLALVITIFTSLASFVLITPNGLGIQEVVGAYVFNLAGFDLTTGLIGIGLLRVIHVIITFSLTPVFVGYLFKSRSLRLVKWW